MLLFLDFLILNIFDIIEIDRVGVFFDNNLYIIFIFYCLVYYLFLSLDGQENIL